MGHQQPPMILYVAYYFRYFDIRGEFPSRCSRVQWRFVEMYFPVRINNKVRIYWFANLHYTRLTNLIIQILVPFLLKFEYIIIETKLHSYFL